MAMFDTNRSDFPNPNNLDDMKSLVIAAAFLIKKIDLSDLGVGMTEQVNDFLKDAKKVEKSTKNKKAA